MKWLAGGVLAALVVVTVMGTAAAHWTHKHDNYPRRPDGLRQIKKVFGRPCAKRNGAVNHNHMRWWAADDHHRYRVNFHRKLGGRRSSNLDHDVKGHISKNGQKRYIRSGIGAYNCRVVSGTNKYSTHSWGIAVDVSWNFEHFGHNGHPCHVVTTKAGPPQVFKRHRWTWGRNFPRRDCMHFQYARGY